MARRSGNKKLKKEILIFCEGETEKLYFEMLNRKYNASNVKINNTIQVSPFVAPGQSLDLVEYVIRSIQKNPRYKKNDVEKIYVVFDKDDQDWERVDMAIRLAKSNGFGVIFSNICFDIWLLMHYEDVNIALERKTIYSKLSNSMSIENYEKNKANSIIKDILYTKVKVAHDRSQKCCDWSCMRSNPFTNIAEEIKNIYGTQKL
ncbi:RloB family protein [Paenibacillus sp. WLX1005]|uniref:RloB family protein n=1 Tax=Paenibacillus sp. WLX1005 TaxID=3243766 RepID=UPI00398434B6